VVERRRLDHADLAAAWRRNAADWIVHPLGSTGEFVPIFLYLRAVKA
jgi:hypothetical protein